MLGKINKNYETVATQLNALGLDEKTATKWKESIGNLKLRRRRKLVN